MGIFSAVRETIVAITKPVISTANTIDESMGMATSYIHNRAVSHTLTDRQYVIVNTAEKMNELDTKLNTDPKLKALYKKLEKEFD